MTVEIRIPKGHVVIVDNIDADLALLSWYPKSYRQPYAQRTIRKGKKYTNEKLHRVIFSRMIGRPLLPTEKVDHHDRNIHNNRRSNLRLATDHQNRANAERPRKNDLPAGVYTQVSKKNGTRYFVRITYLGKKYRFGYYATPEEAHSFYKKTHVFLHGEFSPYYQELTDHV